MLYLISGGMDMADAIVFTQDELLAALNADAEDILLCDNNFHLPPKRNITYTAIGHVTAWADFSDAADFNITCIGFSPKTKKRPKTVHISNKAIGTASIQQGSSFSSFGSGYGSYNSSYRLSASYRHGSYGSGYMLTSYGGSYSTNYRLWSGYKMSFRYQTSYGSNYNTSYSSSYSTSYRLSSSYKSSFSQSFTISSFIHGFKRKIYTRVLKEISVNGYGIHLI